MRAAHARASHAIDLGACHTLLRLSSTGGSHVYMSTDSSRDFDERAVHAAAIAFLKQRSFSTSSSNPKEVKINEMLARDYGKASRYALHVGACSQAASYEESYVKLGAWIRSRPPEQARKARSLFPRTPVLPSDMH